MRLTIHGATQVPAKSGTVSVAWNRGSNHKGCTQKVFAKDGFATWEVGMCASPVFRPPLWLLAGWLWPFAVVEIGDCVVISRLVLGGIFIQLHALQAP